MADELLRVTAGTAAEVCRRYRPGERASALLAEGMTPGAFVAALTAAGLDEEAEAFLAHGLGKREAVWWACRCAREALGSSPSPAAAEALAAAEAWAASPGDVNRRKAEPAAERVGYGHPAGCAALAAFLGGGSLSPPGMAEVPPAEHLTGQTVAAAVQLAALIDRPEAAPERHRRFLAIGLDVARGADRWPDPR